MPIQACLVCKSSFYAKPSHIAKGWGKYCSTICRTKSQYKGKRVNCFICNKEVYRSLKDLRSSKSKKFFCSKTCQTIWRNTILFTGENHANWKHGKSAYRRILRSTGKEEICVLCRLDNARVLIVHHIDKNRNNNGIENLIWLCQNCHYLVHHYTDDRKRLSELT